MTEHEVAQIREIVKAVMAEERAQREKDDFYIKRAELYNTHRRAVTFFGAIDAIGAVVGKTIVYSFLVGAASLVIWAMGRMK